MLTPFVQQFDMKIKHLRIIAKPRRTSEPKRRPLTRILLVAAVALGGGVTAFGIAPDTVTDTVPRRTITENLLLEVAPESAELPEVYTFQETAQRGDTLASLDSVTCTCSVAPGLI